MENSSQLVAKAVFSSSPCYSRSSLWTSPPWYSRWCRQSTSNFYMKCTRLWSPSCCSPPSSASPPLLNQRPIRSIVCSLRYSPPPEPFWRTSRRRRQSTSNFSMKCTRLWSSSCYSPPSFASPSYPSPPLVNQRPIRSIVRSLRYSPPPEP